ncbi:MAG TPA: hypothetical protein VHM70_08105 [Polyangiaceae bacterium]|nr:hypothetical protein [Polyangiaceae bacterium]
MAQSGWAVISGVWICISAITGCALPPQAHAPDDLPPLQIDLAASEVRANSLADAAQLRSAIAGDLGTFAAREGSPRPTRFLVTVDQKTNSWPMFACLVAYTILGCPTATVETDVELTLELQGRTLHGKGHFNSAAGLYYDQNGVKGALGATRLALADALRSGS